MKKSLSIFLISLLISNIFCSMSLDKSITSMISNNILSKVLRKNDESNDEKEEDNTEDETQMPSDHPLMEKQEVKEKEKEEESPKEEDENKHSKTDKDLYNMEYKDLEKTISIPEDPNVSVETPEQYLQKSRRIRTLKGQGLQDNEIEEILAKEKVPQAPVQRLVPSQKALDETVKLSYAYGTYKTPKKMWYYLTRRSIYTCIHSYRQVLYEDFILPVFMKELQITFLTNMTIRSYNYRYGHYSGFIMYTKIDNTKVSTNRKEYTATSPHSRYNENEGVIMEGTLFNVPAGQHRFSLWIDSMNFYELLINDNRIIHQNSVKTTLSMVGYPASS